MSDDNLKVPSQVFRWFEKMKHNYENSVQIVLRQFETFTTAQQERVDCANQELISNLKSMHSEQHQQSQDTILHLKNDIDYYKQQVTQQHQTIEQLNTRYDAMMSCLLAEKRKDIDIKDIFAEDDVVSAQNTQKNSDLNILNQDLIHQSPNDESDDIFEQAMIHRSKDEHEKAFSLFQQASQNGHIKAMGAMG